VDLIRGNILGVCGKGLPGVKKSRDDFPEKEKERERKSGHR